MMYFPFIIAWLADHQLLVQQLSDNTAKESGSDLTTLLVALIPTLITGIISIILGLKVNQQGRHQFFSTTVSRERMEWIKEMRALSIELCTLCERYENEEALPPDQLTAFLKARNGMLLHLNHPNRIKPVEHRTLFLKTWDGILSLFHRSKKEDDKGKEYSLDKNLIEMLETKGFQDIKENVKDIRQTCMNIFKDEWDKVKIEAGNSPSKVRKIKEMQESINRENSKE